MPDSVRMIQQTLPFLGGALREGLLAARGSHVIVMYSDGESDPRSVIDLIDKARENPESVVSASRWLNGNSFEDDPTVKTLLNYLFQKTFSLLYWKKLTDFTFGYRIHPTQLIQAIEWQETAEPPLCSKASSSRSVSKLASPKYPRPGKRAQKANHS